MLKDKPHVLDRWHWLRVFCCCFLFFKVECVNTLQKVRGQFNFWGKDFKVQNCLLCSPSPLVLEGHTRLRAGQQVCLHLLFRWSPLWEPSVLELLQVRAAAWPPCVRAVDVELWICRGEHSYFFSLVGRTQDLVLAFSSFFDWWFLVFCARLLLNWSLSLPEFLWGDLGDS